VASVRATLGAIRAFSTVELAQNGQDRCPPDFSPSKLAEDWNQLSKV
jgi:hypothetical protein